MSNEHNFVFCATAWAGFAAEDLGNIVAVLADLSKFDTVADRMQQGFLQQLLLGRALIHPQGLTSNAAFQKNGQSVIDTQPALLRRQLARAASWAARSPRWRPTSTAPCSACRA